MQHYSSLMNPELVDFPASKHITGLAVRTSNARERDPATAALPNLWGRFTAAQTKHAGGDQPAAPVYSVYTEYESDVNGAYTVVLGREDVLPEFPESADGMVIVSAGRYLVFSSTERCQAQCSMVGSTSGRTSPPRRAGEGLHDRLRVLRSRAAIDSAYPHRRARWRRGP